MKFLPALIVLFMLGAVYGFGGYGAVGGRVFLLPDAVQYFPEAAALVLASPVYVYLLIKKKA